MNKWIYHILFRVLGIFLCTMAVADASAQIVVDQCDTMQFSVTSRPGIDDTHFVWGIYEESPGTTDIIDPAGTLDPAITFVDGQYAGRNVKVTGLQPGRYYVRIHVWDEISCTDNVEMYLLEVVESVPQIALEGDEVCIGDPAIIRIIFTGLGPFEIDYSYGDALTGTVVNVNGVVVDGPEATIPILDPLPEGETTFWIMRVTDDCKVYTYEEDERPNIGIRIYPKPSNSKIYLRE